MTLLGSNDIFIDLVVCFGFCYNNIMKLSFVLAFAAVAFALPAQADFYWQLSGVLKDNAGQRSDRDGNGLGCWLELTNDVAGVDYKPVKIYDIRRKTTGGTDLVKYSDSSGHIPFDGCRYGEAEVDLTLPIRDADGISYTLTAINSYSFQENQFIGKVVLTSSLEYIGHRAFRNCYYLRTVTFPDPATWTPQYIGKESDGGRAFEGCSRLEGDIVWPDNLTEVPQYTFSGDSALKGFHGKGVTTYRAGSFHSVPSAFCFEMSEAESIAFRGQVINNSNLSKVVWHGTPPSTGDYFSKSSNNFMAYSKTSRVHYIPYDETQEDGVPARWATYKTAFEEETSGNSLTFPVYDATTGTQTDGSWYISGRSSNADKVRFWFPGKTAALLMK